MKKDDLSGETLIYLITKGEATEQNFAAKKSEILKLVHNAVQANISFIQIREKKLAARFVFEIAREAAKIASDSKTKILINDRADIALAAEADGVHLTSTSLSAQVIRQKFPPDFIIGVSAHSLETAEIAKQEGADFVTFSPIFDSPGKGESHGIKKLKEVCEKLKPFPVIALGGVDETNWREILSNSASGLAAIRFLNDEKNLAKISSKIVGFARK